MDVVVKQLLLGAKESLAPEDRSLLLERYQRLYQQATSVYKQIKIEPEDFARYLGERLAGTIPIEEELAEFTSASELYLACGCSRGNPEALHVFYQEYESYLRASLSKLHLAPDRIDEFWALVCDKLLVAQDGRAPRISEYRGRGQLLTWLRVVAVRTAISELRKKPRETSDEQVLRDVVSSQCSPQRALMQAEAQSYVKAAFQQAMTELTVRQRNLLRQHLIDNLTIDDLGTLYQVHRVTAARWLSKARSVLWSKTKKHLRSELGISSPQLESLLGDIRSTLDLSIERALTE